MKLFWIFGSLLLPLALAPIAQAETPRSDEMQLSQADPLQNVCYVVNLQQGQLAVRNSPGGQSRAGLDNYNMVEVYRQQGNWSCVRVLEGPNSRVAGIEGWVNSSYLECDQRNCYRACGSLIETRNRVKRVPVLVFVAANQPRVVGWVSQGSTQRDQYQCYVTDVGLMHETQPTGDY